MVDKTPSEIFGLPTPEIQKLIPGLREEAIQFVEKRKAVRRRRISRRRREVVTPSTIEQQQAREREATRAREIAEQQEQERQLRRQRSIEAEVERQRRIDVGRIETQIRGVPTPEIQRFIPGLREEAQRFIEERRRIPISEVQPARRLGVTERLERVGERVTQRRLRGERVPAARVVAFGAAVAAPIISFPVSTFRLGKGLVTEPITTVRAIPGGFREAGITFFEQLGGPTPERAVGGLFGEALVLKGTGKAIGVAGRGLEVTRTRVSPLFRPVERGRIRRVPLETRIIDIPLVPSAKQITTPLRLQARLAGTTQEIISAQTDFLGKLFQRQKRLERTFFGDPLGRLRVGRFKEPPPAKLVDIFGGEVTFRRPRRQALVFEREPIAPLPKDIARAFEAERPLTAAQRRALIQFQEIPTGQFKPIGFISREPEVILPAGEIVRRRRGRAVTLVEGRRVEIVQAEIGRATPRTRKLLRKSRLTSKERLELERRLARESGFDISSIVREGRPFVSPVRAVSPVVSLRRISLPRPRPTGISRRVFGISKKDLVGISPVGIPRVRTPTFPSPTIISPAPSPLPAFRPVFDIPFVTPAAPIALGIPSVDLITSLIKSANKEFGVSPCP